jgi:hypothetical protein
MSAIVSLLVGLAVSIVTWLFPDSGKQFIKEISGATEFLRGGNAHAKPNSASVVQAATGLSVAATKYKDALTSPNEAVLGGKYAPKIGFGELTRNSTLSTMANLDLMGAVPNMNSIPENQTPSIGYSMCGAIAGASHQVDSTITEYNSKIPEILFSDIGRIRNSEIYKYFSRFGEHHQCDLFSGQLKYNLDQKRRQVSHNFAAYPIPFPLPHFSASDFLEYAKAVQTLDQDTNSIVSGNMHVGD